MVGVAFGILLAIWILTGLFYLLARYAPKAGALFIPILGTIFAVLFYPREADIGNDPFSLARAAVSTGLMYTGIALSIAGTLVCLMSMYLSDLAKRTSGVGNSGSRPPKKGDGEDQQSEEEDLQSVLDISG